jgi:hypothetical protein
MGKFESERDFLYAHVRRYLDYVHGGGVRGNPNSASLVVTDRSKALTDPWNSAYYNGENNDAHVWYRLAKEFQSPEFLWASEQASLGGRPPDGREVPPEYIAAYQRRYAWFVERGIEPKAPAGGSKIGYYSPVKHKVPERLYLCPGRESGKPFVSFYVYDRNNNYMHYNDDVMGQLYEYAVDGAKLLHTSGKYNSNAMKTPAAYDALWVQHPAVDFVTGRAGDIPYGTWNTASMPLPGLLNSRHAPDSRNWCYDEEEGVFRRTDDPEWGFAHGNMDGYWYLNNQFHLTSLEFDLVDPVVELRELRLAGPKGDRSLIPSWKQIPKSLTVTATAQENGDKRVVWRGGDAFGEVVSLVAGKPGADGKRGRVLRIRGEDGIQYSVRLDDIDMTFDASRDYTRVLIDHNGRISAGEFYGSRGGHDAGFELNGRSEYITYDTRGGILVRDSLRAENRHGDSFGQFTYRNYLGAYSRWTRQTVLTEEGYLVVRDVYEPGRDVDGYVVGPCWLLRPDCGWREDDQPDRGPTNHNPRQNWFDAPAWDHAWWQTQKKRILVWIHPGQGKTFGVTGHDTSADISRKMGFEYYPTQNSHAKAIAKADTPEVFLSVLAPFNEGLPAREVAARIKTCVDNAANCTATVDRIAITVNANGTWRVER